MADQRLDQLADRADEQAELGYDKIAYRWEASMVARKVAVTIDAELLEQVDRWVATGEFPNRSRAVQAGLARLHEDRARRHSLLRELAKLDPGEERALAEEWLVGEAPWPEY